MFWAKVHQTEKGLIIAICDAELLGNVFAEKEISLDLKTYSYFYKGKLFETEEEVLPLFQENVYSINLVGNRIVALARKKGILKESGIINVAGIAHAQIYWI